MKKKQGVIPSKVTVSKVQAGERTHFVATSKYKLDKDDNLEVWVWPNGEVSWKTTATAKGACVVIDNAARKQVAKLLSKAS